MSKRVLVISTSPREMGNSYGLAEAFAKGAKEAGNEVALISLSEKTLSFCKGCLACQVKKDGHCIQHDDLDVIVSNMAKAEVIAFATPIYFYSMCAQMKTLLDRSNPLYPIDYQFRDIYLLTSAADEEKSAMDGAIQGLQGWIDCFDKASLKGVVYGTALDTKKELLNHPELCKEAYDMGNQV